MDLTVKFATFHKDEPDLATSADTLIKRLTEKFGSIRFPETSQAIMSDLKKCFMTMAPIFPKISASSMEILVRMTICALQTHSTLDNDLRQVICTGSFFLNDKNLAQELRQETEPENLARNSQWIQILQQPFIQHLKQNGDLETLRKILGQLANAVKLTELASETSEAFRYVILNVPLLWDDKHAKEYLSAVHVSFICDFCKKSFAKKHNLLVHLRIHINNHPFSCNLCSNTFLELKHLVQHSQTHTEDVKPLSCIQTDKKSHVCEKAFLRKKHLVNHKRIHSEDKPFSCSVCKKTFRHKKTLKSHERIHSSERPHQCAECNYTFREEHLLNKHKQIHVKRYVCGRCYQRFSKIKELNKHSLTHSQNNLYTCKICIETFANMRRLIKHNEVHTGKKTFWCFFCNSAFKSRHYFKNHQVFHAGLSLNPKVKKP